MGIFGSKFRGGLKTLTFGANFTLLHYHYKHFPRVKFLIIPFRFSFEAKMTTFWPNLIFGSISNRNWLFLLNQSQFRDRFGLFGTSESVQKGFKVNRNRFYRFENPISVSDSRLFV